MTAIVSVTCSDSVGPSAFWELEHPAANTTAATRHPARVRAFIVGSPDFE